MPPDRAHDADLEILAAGEAAEGKSELRLWLRMLSATNLISAEIRRRLRVAFSVTLPQFDLMAQLAREPEGLRLGVLSKRMMVTNGNVTGLIDRLESEGLVERGSAAGDGRVTVARLTAKGTAQFERMARVHETWVKELLSEVEAGNARTLFRLLGGVKQSVVAHTDKDAV